ncbi:MAG: alpha-L-fucosidase [Planctomycetota bacterium]
MAHRTDWFRDCGWGVNIAFMAIEGESEGGAEIPAEEWNRQVNGFDCEGLADQFAGLGVGYCFLTLGQNSGHYCSPNGTYDEIVGISPSKCSTRDLFADLAAALKPHGIRLMAYLPSGAPAADKVACEKLEWEWGYEGNWPNGHCDNLRTGKRLEAFQLKWEAITREWSERWGDSCWGWWIDGCYFDHEMYRNPRGPNFQTFAAALKSGNPDSLVAFNPGQEFPIIAHSEYEDFTAGEGSGHSFALCRGRWCEVNHCAVQWHTYNWIGPEWGRGTPPRVSPEFVIGYTEQVTRNQGVVTWDVPFNPNGTIQDDYLSILQRLAEAVPPGKAD